MAKSCSIIDSDSIENNVESIKNFGNSDISFSQSSSSEVPKKLESDRMEVTSLPEIIQVHEQGQNSPKTPTMIDYKIEEAENGHCMKCKTIISANDGCCYNCSSINITGFDNEKSFGENEQESEKLALKRRRQRLKDENFGKSLLGRIRKYLWDFTEYPEKSMEARVC